MFTQTDVIPIQPRCIIAIKGKVPQLINHCWTWSWFSPLGSYIDLGRS